MPDPSPSASISAARVAGVLSIAVFGIVMIQAFGSQLDYRLAHLLLPPDILHQLQADEVKLAGLQVPAGLSPGTRAYIEDAIGEAFVFGFRMVMWICAGLSLASAAVAWLLIPGNRDRHGLAVAPHQGATRSFPDGR